jgi:hypothetical protein
MIRISFVAVSLALTAAGCAGENQDRDRSPTGIEGGLGNSPKTDAACYIYPLYSVGDCSILVKRSTLTGSVKDAYTYPSSSDARYRAPANLIDLTRIDLNRQITKNFRLSEYMSAAKGRYGYIAEHVFGLMQKVRDSLGTSVRITSGYRSPGYNKKVGGVRLSRHIYGDGVDIASAAGKTRMQSACRSAGASYIQLYADGHVHCDWRSHRLDDTFAPGSVRSTEVTPAMASAMSEESFKAMQEEIGGKPEIVLTGAQRAGGSIAASAFLDAEDGGELLTEWIIVYPDGQRFDGEGSDVALDLVQRGRYEIHVRVGGYAEQSVSFEVP